MILILSNFGSILLFQVLEYHPEPWDQWVAVGSFEVGRSSHAVLSIGVEHLPCLSGKDDDLSKTCNTITDCQSVLLRLLSTGIKY